MRELIERWNSGERRAAKSLLALVAAAAALFLYTWLVERPSANRLVERRDGFARQVRTLEPQWRKTREERDLWRQAARDIDALRTTRLYSQAKGAQELRLDLQALFNAAGFAVDDLRFIYADFPKAGVQKVNADFAFSGSYAALRVFLDRVERHSKFLYVEKVDFVDIGSQPGVLEMRITMAGYYAL